MIYSETSTHGSVGQQLDVCHYWNIIALCCTSGNSASVRALMSDSYLFQSYVNEY